ncbi:glutathionylspermidine synthase family protein [Emcibacter sp.]|uniref:glutathionylspermidine synthase family protein n=1 Tax=Emcibacter sp. TaxID=1979954 RepID=UPI002AA6826C|nr:glutathionylspermidine synthase family protein [Emcibacter sp.]
MTRTPSANPEPFGALLGHGPGNVPIYSSDYKSVDKQAMPDRRSFKNYVNGVFMGMKWQCVELARRWLYMNRGYVFDDIAMAYDIFNLRHVTVVEDGRSLPLYSFRNGAKRPPEPGALIIWNEGGDFPMTGHVAVVTEVTDTAVRIIEQNVEHVRWKEETSWSRELPLHRTDDGGYVVNCTFSEGIILGWVIQTDDPTHAEVLVDPDPALFNLSCREADLSPETWLDVSSPAQAAFVKYMDGHRLATRDEDLNRYYVMSETARKEVKRATNELHAMFMRATDYVLDNPEVLEKFGLPEGLLPRIRQSWQNRRTHNITGRFDFAMTDQGLKVYEYNADSASCYMECGLVQGEWARAHGVDEGRDAGGRLGESLIKAWTETHVEDVLHILQDDDPEEDYHALYMKSMVEEAGVRCKIITGLAGLGWDADGWVTDPDGERISWVWKTWAWETALDQLRDEAVDEVAFLASHSQAELRDHPPRLIDILLRPEVMVFEPLWTLITSNKAILPVLWALFPNHPYLLESHFELTDNLTTGGYVVKPIVGRCGGNISLIGKDDNLLLETGGQFADRDQIYQALFKLPDIDGLRVQVCSFSVDGRDAGVCVRCDPSLVIRSDSDLLALRIVEDEAFLEKV